MSDSDKQLRGDGWVPLAGPFAAHEEAMMAGFIADADANNKDIMRVPLGKRADGYRADATVLWQRSKRFATKAIAA
jgi:hypothetical protein